MAAAEFVLSVRDAAASIEGAVATVGRLEVEPGAANVIPARVTLSVDARAPDRERLDRLVAALGFEPQLLAPRRSRWTRIRAVLRRSSSGRRAAPELVSGAGHDAGVLAAAGVPMRDALRPQPERRRQPLARGVREPEDIALAVDVARVALGDSALSEDDRLRAFPEEASGRARAGSRALDDRREVVAGELARLAREAGVAVGEQDLGLADAARVEESSPGSGSRSRSPARSRGRGRRTGSSRLAAPRAWMIRLSSGSSRRNAATVCGAPPPRGAR